MLAFALLDVFQITLINLQINNIALILVQLKLLGVVFLYDILIGKISAVLV